MIVYSEVTIWYNSTIT